MAGTLQKAGQAVALHIEVFSGTLSSGTDTCVSQKANILSAHVSLTEAPAAAVQPYVSWSGNTVTITDAGSGDKTYVCTVISY